MVLVNAFQHNFPEMFQTDRYVEKSLEKLAVFYFQNKKNWYQLFLETCTLSDKSENNDQEYK